LEKRVAKCKDTKHHSFADSHDWIMRGSSTENAKTSRKEIVIRSRPAPGICFAAASRKHAISPGFTNM
jgi:hypothetical protein